MAQEFFPFDAGAGASITETQWRRMARLFSPTGVETGLAVSNGTGSNVNVAAGSAWVDGHYYRTDATVAVPFTPNTLAQPQLVRVVARLDPTANTITPACTTSAPVQQATGVYELLLAEFTLPPSGTAQTPTSLTDRRYWPGPQQIIENKQHSVNGTTGTGTVTLSTQYEMPIGRAVAVDFAALITNAQFTSGNKGQATLEYATNNSSSWSQLCSAWTGPLHGYAITDTATAAGQIPAVTSPTRIQFRVRINAIAPDSTSVTRLDAEIITLVPLGAP